MTQHMSGPSDLSGQVAFITGGAGGMGRAISAAFAAAGAKVIATDRAAKEDLGAGIEYLQYDVTSRAETDAVMDAVIAKHGKEDAEEAAPEAAEVPATKAAKKDDK